MIYFAPLFFLLLQLLVTAHINYVAGWSLLWTPLFFVVLAAVWLGLRNRSEILMRVLALINTWVLLLVSLYLSTLVWTLLQSGSVAISTGHLLPLFVSVLILYIFGIYINAQNTPVKSRYPLDPLVKPLLGPPLLISLCTALILTTYLLLLLHGAEGRFESAEHITKRFLQRGIIPPITLLMFFWASLLLAGKISGIWYLRQVISGYWKTLPNVKLIKKGMKNVRSSVAGREEYINVLWQRSAESYLLPRYINWAVPILGFIGTVLGISLAAEQISRIISSADGLSSLSGDLSQAIAPLGIAFDTTLIALSLSIVLTLFQTLVQRREDRLLVDIALHLNESSGD